MGEFVLAYGPRGTIHNASKAQKQSTREENWYIFSPRQEEETKLEVEWGYTFSKPTPTSIDMLLPGRLHLLNVPQPLQMEWSIGDQVFKYLTLSETIVIQNTHTHTAI